MIIVLELFTGCGTDRVAKTWEEFEAITIEKGYVINDDTVATGEGGAEVMDKLSVAVKDGVYQIEFYDFKQGEESEAEDLFLFIQDTLDEMYSTKQNVKKISSSNYNFYGFESGEVFELVIRVGDTLLYSGTSIEYKEEVNRIVELMKY